MWSGTYKARGAKKLPGTWFGGTSSEFVFPQLPYAFLSTGTCGLLLVGSVDDKMDMVGVLDLLYEGDEDLILDEENFEVMETQWLATTGPPNERFARGFHCGTHIWIELCRQVYISCDAPKTLALSDVHEGWLSLALACLLADPTDDSVDARHRELRSATGSLLCTRGTSELMDDPALRSEYIEDREEEPAADAGKRPRERTKWYTVSQPVVVTMETFDRAISKWQRMACAHDVVACRGGDLPPQLAANSTMDLIHRMCGQPPVPYTDLVGETIKRVRMAVLRYCCGLSRLVSHMSASADPSSSPYSSQEEAMCSIFKGTYMGASVVPGDPEYWAFLHPHRRSTDTEAVKNMHPAFYAKVYDHLSSIGTDLCILQSRKSAGPYPAAMSVACTELLFQCIGSYNQDEAECVGAAVLWGAYVIDHKQYFERREQLQREPDMPMLLCGPGGMRCVWRERIQQGPDPADPWGPVAIWFALARRHDPGCASALKDADCHLASGSIRLAPFIKDAGAIWK